MKLIGLILIIFLSSLASGTEHSFLNPELIIDSPLEGYRFRDQQGRVNLIGHINFPIGPDSYGGLGKVFCNDRESPVHGPSYSWKINNLKLPSEGYTQINCHYEWEGTTSTKRVTVFWSKTNNPATARFTMSPEVGRAPLEVTLDASSSSDPDGSIVLYSWDFGDGTNASGINASSTHTFHHAGTYQVTLTVVDNENAYSSVSKSIVIDVPSQKPLGMLSADPTTGTIPFTVNFDASLSHDPDGGTIKEYYYDFGDGTSEVSSLPYITHTYTSEGPFMARLQVKDTEDELSTSVGFPIQAFQPNFPPVAVIESNPESGQSPLLVNFNGASSFDTDGTIQSYTWYFPDGSTATGVNVSKTLIGQGPQTVSLTVVDDKHVPNTAQIVIELTQDTDHPVISMNPSHNSVIRTSTPQFEIIHTDSTSGIDLGSIRATLNGEDVSDRLNTAPERSFLTFTQEFPITQGQYTLRIDLEDNAGNAATLEQTYHVDLGIIDTAYIVGQVVDADGVPLENIVIQDVFAPYGLKIKKKSYIDGKFKIPFNVAGTYRFSFSKTGYTESIRTIVPVIVEDIDMGVIQLMASDSLVTLVSASAGGVASNSTNTFTSQFEPGVLPFDINFNATEFTKPQTMPGPLPAQSAFTYALDLRPQGVNFGGSGVRSLLDNYLGFPVGMDIVLGIFDRETGRWLDSGRSDPVVATEKSASGSAISFIDPFFYLGDWNQPILCMIASNCNPPDAIGGGSSGGGSESGGGGGGTTGGCSGGSCCGSGAGGVGGGSGETAGGSSGGNFWASKYGLGGGPKTLMGCEISAASGDLSVTHDTPSLTGAGESNFLKFRYHSTTVKPHFFAGATLNIFNPDPADYIESMISIAGRTITGKYEGSGATKESVYRVLIEGKNADGIDFPTGLYTYTGSFTVAYSNSEYATASYFGAPPRTRTGVLTRVPLTFTSIVQEDVPVLNRKLSPFGAGWSINGLEKLHVSPSGKILRDLGSKMTVQYTPTASIPVLEEKKLVSKKSASSVKLESLVAFDGMIFGTDCENNQVFRISPSGKLDVVAGNGERGFTGDGGPAIQASLNCPVAVAKAEKGGFYIADRDNYSIRRVFKDGSIKTIAKHKNQPLSVSEDKMRAVFFTTSTEVMLITPRGKLETYSSEDEGYLPVKLNNPSQVLFNNEEYPIVVDKNNGRILTLYPQNGSFTSLFGKGSRNKVNKDGKIRPKTLTFDPVSHLYYLLDDQGKIYHWDGMGKRDLTELSFKGNLLRDRKFGGKSDVKISAMAYSSETGLVIATEDQIFMKKENNSQRDSSVSYVTQTGFSDELTRLENGTFEILEIDKTRRTYNVSGQITAILRPDGQNIFYQYNSENLLKEIQYPGDVRFYFEYDGRGYLQTVRDSSGRETNFQINEKGNLLRIDSPDGSNKEYAYDPEALLISETKEDGEITEFNYVMNRLSSEVIAGNRERFFTPLALTGLIPSNRNSTDLLPIIVPRDIQSVGDASKSGDCKVRYRVNDKGAMTEQEDCLGGITTFEPNEGGMFEKIISPEGRIATRTFDSKQRLTSSTDWNGLTSFGYDFSTGKIATLTDALNYRERFTYNSQGSLETYVDQKENVTTFGYNTLGDMILIKDALLQEYHLDYDAKQNLKSITDPLSNTVEFLRDNFGNIIQHKDQLDRVTEFEFDDLNRLTALLAPLDYDTFLTYTPGGKLKTLTDASNATTTWDYDPVSQKVSTVTNTEGQSSYFAYDLNDRLQRSVNKDGSFREFTYDKKGRLKTRSSSTHTNSYSYDKDNLLIFASNPDSAVTMNYDEFGRLRVTEASHVPGQLVLTYDQRGLRKTLNYSINNVSVLSVGYSYDERRLLSGMNASLGGQSISWQRYWDELGRPDEDLLSNGLKVQRDYDPAGRMTLLSNEYANGEPLSRFELSYNATGTIKEILKTFIRPDQDTTGRYVLKYTYDELDRLTYASTDGNFTYDIMGNHTNRGQVHNRLNHLLEDADNTYNYTTNGELSQKVSKSTGEKTEYTWNGEGKIVQTTVKGADGSIKTVIVNSYDAFQRRISRESSGQLSRFAYDGEDLIIEFGINNTIKAIYLHGPGIDEPIAMARDLNDNGSMEGNEVFFYSKDHLNSVHDLTDSEGKPIQRYNYTAYGRTKVEKMSTTPFESFVPNAFAYTSREWEQETGDYYYRARNYNPYSGRFLSEDPLGTRFKEPNLYRYVLNDPISNSDPTGLEPWAIQWCPETLGEMDCPKTKVICYASGKIDAAESSNLYHDCGIEEEDRKKAKECKDEDDPFWKHFPGMGK